YIIKPYIEGMTLRQYILGKGPMNEMEVKRVANQLIDVFEYLHSRPEPFIFRDLKPANIVVTPEFQIVLIDLETMRQTRNEQASDTFYVGTHGYASPEQYGYKQSDERSDIYTIGATLYFLLTGLEPTINIKNLKHVTDVNPEISSHMASIISTCMAFNPEDRFKNVSDIKKALHKKYHINPKTNRMAKISACVLLILVMLFSFRHMALEAIVDIIEEKGYIEPEVETKVETKINVVMRDPSVGNLPTINLPRTDEIYMIEGKSTELFPPEPESISETINRPNEEQEPVVVEEPVAEPLPEPETAIEDTIASVTVPKPEIGPEPEPEPVQEYKPEPVLESNYISPVDHEEYLSIPTKFIYLENEIGSVGYRLLGGKIIFKFTYEESPSREWGHLFLMGDTPGLSHEFKFPEDALSFLVTIDLYEYKQFKEGIIIGFGGSFMGVNDEFCDYLGF
ncbi:MAG: serine/threonine-protein kinase, partial [Bacillota bacterium]|nr:serine/threonine-protein kinase [Bacillota bacterium]